MSRFIPSMQINNGKLNTPESNNQISLRDAEKIQRERIEYLKKEEKRIQEEKIKNQKLIEENGIHSNLVNQMGNPYARTMSLRRNNAADKFKGSTFDNKLNTSFSGVDTKLSITFEGGEPVVVGEVQTVTYSLFRPIEPVYSLGDARPTGFVRGQRTIAGSIIFTVFDRNVLLSAFYNAYAKHTEKECVNQEYLTDELPPFDMHITFMNEYGVSAALAIYGCYVPTEGQVHSIEDMITENTLQYVAQDITLMKPGDIT